MVIGAVWVVASVAPQKMFVGCGWTWAVSGKVGL